MAEDSKIGLGTYPYLNTRVRVMKGLMIKKGEYDKLIKMSNDEIAKFIGDSVYKREIDELALNLEGATLVESALNLNASRCFRKLMRISSSVVEMLVRAYLTRYDVYNLKTIMRAKVGKASADDLRRLLIPAGSLNSSALESLIKKETVFDILKSSKIVQIDTDCLHAVDEFEKTGSLSRIENYLDKSYYNNLIELAKKMPKQGIYVREFIRTEIDFLNLKVLFRLIREKFPVNDIIDMLIFSGERLPYAKLLKLASSKDCDELYSSLEGTGYDKVIESSIDDLRDKNELGSFEIAFEKYWLRKAGLMMNKHPLSIGPAIGYMICKDIEVRNLRMLVRAKALGLDEKFMSDSLVI